jgi:integrase/recombinase XerD
MQEVSFQAEKHFQGNPLEFHLRTFTTSLLKNGYRDRTVQEKLWLLADCGRWLGRTGHTQLPSSKGLRARTFTILFGLLVASGMRVNEALGLDQPDVDLDLGILHIRQTKFRKSRYVPIHPTTVVALKKYAEARDRLFPAPSTPAFFIAERGRRITGGTARYTFAKPSQQLGLRVPAKHHGRGPRLHDLRHRFAARTLIQWYRAGLDVERELPKLTTYLGHVYVNDTYWYLEALPELLQLATDRLIHREVSL